MKFPTFYHQTVLLNEAVDGLNIKPGGIYVDATFGGGGHTNKMLEKLGPDGKIFAFDQDEDAWRNRPDDNRVQVVKENFRYMKRFLRMHQVLAVDGILADLGVSSYQFDTAGRGFSLRFDGPLDMRMDRRQELKASDVVQNYSEAKLQKLFEEYGEVRNARQLAKCITDKRSATKLNTVETLKATVAEVVKGMPAKYFAQMFQALRMEVNDETGALKDLLEQAATLLKPGGRLSVITFHSIEDRLVKQFVKKGHFGEQDNVQNELIVFRQMTPKPIEPTDEEMKKNPRSRSAKLRIAEKI